MRRPFNVRTKSEPYIKISFTDGQTKMPMSFEIPSKKTPSCDTDIQLKVNKEF
jgi:hypothetical protein